MNEKIPFLTLYQSLSVCSKKYFVLNGIKQWVLQGDQEGKKFVVIICGDHQLDADDIIDGDERCYGAAAVLKSML